jgi:Tol biopolymer transport system component
VSAEAARTLGGLPRTLVRGLFPIAAFAATCLAAGCGGAGSEVRQSLIASTCGDEPQICVMNDDGEDVRRLTEGTGNETPSWSPDGERIAFTSQRDGNWEIYVMNAEGSDQKRLTRTSSGAALAYPRWSPDGAKLAYVSYSGREFGPGVASDIHIMNADGTGQVNLTRSTATDFDPAWSPDGGFLAFSSDRDGDDEFDVSVYLIDVQSGEVERYTTWVAITPAFSPDGTS